MYRKRLLRPCSPFRCATVSAKMSVKDDSAHTLLFVGVCDIMDLDYIEIGRNIRKYRNNAHLNQKELAELVNLSSQHISHIENGYSKLSLPTLVAIANALSVDCNSLLGETLTGAREELLSKELLSLFKGMDMERRRLCVEITRVLANGKR